MANVFLNVSDITGAALATLESQIVLAKFVNRQYDNRFAITGAKNGSVANVRKPGKYVYRDGRVASPQDFNESEASITLNQIGADIELDTKSLTLNLNDFRTSILEPLIAPVAARVDGLCYAALDGVVYQAAGTNGTIPSTILPFARAKAICMEAGAPADNNWAAIVSQETNVVLIDGLKGLFHSASDIEKQYSEGIMGMAAGLKFSAANAVLTHTSGSMVGTTICKTTIAEGANTMLIDDVTTGTKTLKKNDIITIANVYAVDPQTRLSTGRLKQFVVTADATTGSDTEITPTLSPAFITTGPTQTCNSLPQTGALVYLHGATNLNGKTGPKNLVLHRDGLTLAHADLVVPPGVEGKFIRSKRLNGLGIRYYQWTDGRADTVLHRFDVCVGAAVLRPELISYVFG